MSKFSVRASSAAILLALGLSGCAQPTPPAVVPTPVGIDLGSAPGRTLPPVTAAPVTDPAPARGADRHAHHATAPAASAAGHGTIDAIDPVRRRITLSHEPMPKIGWPAMTMVFLAPPAIDLTTFKAGDHVGFSLMKKPDGSYGLQSLQPVHH